jgi:hypothetical protein
MLENISCFHAKNLTINIILILLLLESHQEVLWSEVLEGKAPF